MGSYDQDTDARQKRKYCSILGIFSDISERKRAELSHRLDESRLESLLVLNQMTGASLQEITDYALEEAVRLTNSDLGYLAFMNDDETVLTMHSWSKKACSDARLATNLWCTLWTPLDYGERRSSATPCHYQ